jgi:flagellar assembly protein FliH
MSHDADLVKAIRAIRQEWELEEKIRSASDSLKEKEMERVKKQVDEAKAEAETILANANKQAKQIIEDGRNQADVFLQQAQKEFQKKETDMVQLNENLKTQLEQQLAAAQRSYDESFTKGQEEGLKQGTQQGLQKFIQTLESLQAVTNAARVQMEGLEKTQIQYIQAFVRAYVEKIVGNLCEKTTACLESNIQRAMAEMTQAVRFKLVVSKKDYEALTAMKERFLRLFPPTSNVEFIKDDTIQPGGCLLETELGSVDATIESQITLLNEELFHD